MIKAAARVLSLHQDGHSCVEIARRLNAEGWRPAKRRETFNASMVASLLARQQPATPRPTPPAAPWPERGPDEWALPELARRLDMPMTTLFSWLYRGWLKTRRVEHAGRPQWLIWADASELERLRAQRHAPRHWAHPPLLAGDAVRTSHAE